MGVRVIEQRAHQMGARMEEPKGWVYPSNPWLVMLPSMVEVCQLVLQWDTALSMAGWPEQS